MTDRIMKYLKDTFSFDYENSFVRNTLENFINYAVDNFNNSKDQLAYYLSEMIDELSFEEIKKVIDESEDI